MWRWGLRRFIVAAIISVSANALASKYDLESERREPIRLTIQSCRSFLIPGDQRIDDSVGIPFTSNTPEDFRQELDQLIRVKGREFLQGARFYVAGVAMKDAKAVESQYCRIETEYEFKELGARIYVLSLPTEVIKPKSVNIARQVMERVFYFFPSIRRDYQTPQLGELVSGFSTSALQEIPNFILMFQRTEALDASLAVTSHAAILGALLIYEKSLINWILRGGSVSERGRRVEMFLKNMLVSLPFILSYNVFGQFSKILRHYHDYGWAGLIREFPEQVGNFAATQGLTMVLQGLFFSQFINSGISAWVNRQVGEEDTRYARTLRPWIEFPILSLDAVLLSWAASGQAAMWFEIGPMTVNSGHIGLATLTATGATLFYLAPNVLNPTLKWYRSLRQFIQRVGVRKG